MDYLLLHVIAIYIPISFNKYPVRDSTIDLIYYYEK